MTNQQEEFISCKKDKANRYSTRQLPYGGEKTHWAPIFVSQKYSVIFYHSNIFIEKRHAVHLSKRNLDEESRLEVIYRVLKDQLRRAKNDLLKIKQEKEGQR